MVKLSPTVQSSFGSCLDALGSSPGILTIFWQREEATFQYMLLSLIENKLVLESKLNFPLKTYLKLIFNRLFASARSSENYSLLKMILKYSPPLDECMKISWSKYVFSYNFLVQVDFPGPKLEYLGSADINKRC